MELFDSEDDIHDDKLRYHLDLVAFDHALSVAVQAPPSEFGMAWAW
jgi:hypothetical protein